MYVYRTYPTPLLNSNDSSCHGAGVGEYVAGDEYFVAEDNNVNDSTIKRHQKQGRIPLGF